MKRYAIYQPLSIRYMAGLDTHDSIKVPDKPVAIVEGESLDEIWTLTQHEFNPNGTSNWVGKLNKGIIPMIRSTAVGDIFYDIEGKQAWVVESVGFSEYTGKDEFLFFNHR